MQPIVNNKFSSADLQNRLNSKIDKSGDCWLWTGSVNSRGYGGIIIDGKYRPVSGPALRLIEQLQRLQPAAAADNRPVKEKYRKD